MPETGNDFTLIARMLSDGFNRIDHRLDELNRRLDGKADIGAVAALETNLSSYKIEVDKRFKPLERTQTEGITIGRLGMWLIGTVGVAVFLASVTLLAAAISGGRL